MNAFGVDQNLIFSWWLPESRIYNSEGLDKVDSFSVVNVHYPRAVFTSKARCS